MYVLLYNIMPQLNDFIQSFLNYIKTQNILTPKQMTKLNTHMSDETAVRVFLTTYIKPEIDTLTYDQIANKYSSLIDTEVQLSDCHKQKLYRFSQAFCKFVK